MWKAFILVALATTASLVQGEDLGYDGDSAAARTNDTRGCSCGGTVNLSSTGTGAGQNGRDGRDSEEGFIEDSLFEEPEKEVERFSGGQTYKAGYAPWMVQISTKSGKSCTGTLLSDTHVLASAECVKGQDSGDISVRLFEQQKQQLRWRIRIVIRLRRVTIVISIWGNRAGSKGGSDMVLLVLSEPLKLSSTMSPVCLPPSGGSDNYRRGLVVMGWKSHGKGDEVDDMAMSPVKVLSSSSCRRMFNLSEAEAKKVTCVYGSNTYDSESDLGTPLLYKGRGGYTQVGKLISVYRKRVGLFSLFGILINFIKYIIENGGITCG